MADLGLRLRRGFGGAGRNGGAGDMDGDVEGGTGASIKAGRVSPETAGRLRGDAQDFGLEQGMEDSADSDWREVVKEMINGEDGVMGLFR